MTWWRKKQKNGIILKEGGNEEKILVIHSVFTEEKLKLYAKTFL